MAQGNNPLIARPVSTEKTALMQLLLKQVEHELENERLYLIFAGWLDVNGWPETAKFFSVKSGEERKHANDFIKFIHQSGCKHSAIPSTTSVPNTVDSIETLLEATLNKEVETTKMIASIYFEALKSMDAMTAEFALHYSKEQREEEQWARSLIRLYKKCKESSSLIDFEIEVSRLLAGEYMIASFV